MSDTESLDYLQAGFDPASLTVPRLRSILVQHNISYPASSKKAQLIEIFNENVLPQSRKILTARSRAKRSSKGIVDVESSQESTPPAEEPMLPPTTPRARSARRTPARTVPEESVDEAPMRSPRKKTVQANTKHPRASDTEAVGDPDDLRRVVRKTRRNEAPTPAKVKVEAEESEDEALPATISPVKRAPEGSAFSYDNPFQSGSSPPSGPRSPSGEHRRRTLGPGSKESPRRVTSSTSRRRTDYPKAAAEQDIHPPTSSTFEIPVSKLSGLKSVDDNGVEAGEEFTADEQMELVRERSLHGENALGPLRPKTKKQGGFSLAGPFWVIFLTILGGYAYWYRQEKLAVGYCGVGRPSRDIVSSKVDLPEWASVFAEPVCELCPQHAYCYQGLETRCEPDFILKPHPLSLGGLVPLPPTCEPDGEKVRRVKAVADRAVEELRERRAKFECEGLVDEQGVPDPNVEIEEEVLKEMVASKRRRGMGSSEFEELWASAIGEVTGREEVETSIAG
jgi:hypothetical protein